MTATLGQVIAREEADRPKERDRDGLPIVEHGVFAQAVHTDRETARGTADGDQIVEAGVARRRLDPAAPKGEPIRPLEEREGRAREVAERAHPGLAVNAQPMVARNVRHRECDVDAARAGVQRDLRAHGAVDQRGRPREPVVAQPGGKRKDQVDRRGHPVAADFHAAPARQALRADRGARV